QRSNTPWLGNAGLAVSAVLFVLGVAYVRINDAQSEGFDSSTAQLIGALLVAALMVRFAFGVGRGSRPGIAGPTPNPWVVGAFSLIASALVMFLNVWTLGRGLTREGPLSGWVSV